MCIICFNEAEISGAIEIGNTYRVKVMDEVINFSPLRSQESELPCYGKINAIIGYTDMRDRYTEALQREVSKDGAKVGKEGMPKIIGISKMLIIEKYYDSFDIESGVEDSKRRADNLRY